MIFVFQGLVQGRRVKSVVAPYTYLYVHGPLPVLYVHGPLPVITCIYRSLHGLGLRLSQDPA